MLALLSTPNLLEIWVSVACGCLMILLVFLSSTLNPLVYFCFTTQTPSITNYLFKMVSILDFLANLPSVAVAGLCLAPTRYTIFWPSTLGLVSCMTGCVAQATTTLLAATRYWACLLIVVPSNLKLMNVVLEF